jgi:hypothetical protein
MDSNQFQGFENPSFQSNIPSEQPLQQAPQEQPVEPISHYQPPQQDFNPVQYPEDQQFPNQVVETPEEQPVQEEKSVDPIAFIRENTPGNDTSAEIEDTDTKDLREQLAFVKDLLGVLIASKKIRNYSDYPDEITQPTFHTSTASGREMILPFGKFTNTVRFGLAEFKKALDNALKLNEESIILTYQSERVGSTGQKPQPRYLKFSEKQVEELKLAIANKESGESATIDQAEPAPTI